MKNVDLVKILDVLLYMCSDLYVYSQLTISFWKHTNLANLGNLKNLNLRNQPSVFIINKGAAASRCLIILHRLSEYKYGLQT